MTYSFQSKLPNSSASIFSVMTALAVKHQAINLSQGFPDYPVDPVLSDAISHYLKQGHNQYAPMAGVPVLREQISTKFKRVHGLDIDADTEITVTAGATQALFTAMSATIHAGDEVIVFEPAYDSYAVTIELLGGKVVPIRLNAPDYQIDWAEVASKVNARTRLIIVNNPNNPTGKVLSATDVQQLAHIIQHSNALLLSDEVYEHLVYDGIAPQTLLSHPVLRERTFVVASFGKLLHATGWKIGYCVAAPQLMAEFHKVHQYNVFSVHTPTQWAIADYLKDASHYEGLPAFFQQKRDFLVHELQNSRFEVAESQGTYFLNLNYRAISDLPEQAFAEHLITEHGIATIPIAAFYHDGHNQQYLRLCFAKKQDTLEQAVKVLQSI